MRQNHSPSHQDQFYFIVYASDGGGLRSHDPGLMSPVLYQLSYSVIFNDFIIFLHKNKNLI